MCGGGVRIYLVYGYFCFGEIEVLFIDFKFRGICCWMGVGGGVFFVDFFLGICFVFYAVLFIRYGVIWRCRKFELLGLD